MAYDDTNTGVLFQNDKDGNEKRPDYKGKLNVEGKEYEIAGWKRLSKTNKPYLSLKISEPRVPVADSKQKVDEVFEVTDEEINLNDIPF